MQFRVVYVRYITFLTTYNSMFFFLYSAVMYCKYENCALLCYYAANIGNFLPFLITNRRVITQKSALLGYFAAEDWHHAYREYAVKSDVSVGLVAANTERLSLYKCL